MGVRGCNKAPRGNKFPRYALKSPDKPGSPPLSPALAGLLRVMGRRHTRSVTQFLCKLNHAKKTYEYVLQDLFEEVMEGTVLSYTYFVGDYSIAAIPAGRGGIAMPGPPR